MKAQIAMQSYTDQTDDIETASFVVELPGFHAVCVIDALCKHFSVDTIAFKNDKYELSDHRVTDGRVIVIQGINYIDGALYQIIAVRRES